MSSGPFSLTDERVDSSGVRAAAGDTHRRERRDQITFAVLERSGGISIMPVG